MKSFFGGGGGGAAAATTAAATDKPELVGAPKPTVLAPSTSARAATTGREKERERAGWDREREQNDAAQSRMTVSGCKAETYTGSVYASVPCTYRYVPYAEVLYVYRVRTVRVRGAVPVRTAWR